MDKFDLVSPYKPSGDQPQAIDKLVEGIKKGYRDQTLLGVTGSGKTFTMANIIARMNRPTLILAHNKILAAQLCSEFKEFFPHNAVEYFVSYYDYYQPEAYIPSTDAYIEKDSAINDEIDKLRHSATLALAERRDVIIVASVSCIYSLGAPEEYRNNVISLRKGMEMSREELLGRLVSIQYERNDVNFVRNKFRVRGDVVEIFPAGSSENAIRVEFFGDEIDRISEIQVVTGNIISTLAHTAIYPASHYVVSKAHLHEAVQEIQKELDERVKWFEEQGKLVEAQRIKQRTLYDIEMLEEIGFCKGIENYSRILAGRAPGSVPYTLLDHFPKDYLLFVDESHVSLPQVRGMSAGDRGRKSVLVDYGFEGLTCTNTFEYENGISKSFGNYALNTAPDAENLFFGNVYGASEHFWSDMMIYDGETDPNVLKQKMLTGEYVIIGNRLDRLIGGPKTTSLSEQLQIGDSISFYRDGELVKTCTILAKACTVGTEDETPTTTTATMHIGGDAPFVYLPDTVFKQIYTTPTLLNYGFNMDASLHPQMEDFLSSYVEKNPSVTYTSTKLLKEQLNSVASMVWVVGSLIGCIMALAGLINFTNMIITNIITRRHEFATMQSIGMTNRQLQRLMVYEGVYYAAGADIIGGVVALLLAVTVLKNVLNSPSMWFFTLHITLVPALVIGVLYLLLAAVIPLNVLHFFNKGTVVERMRTSE